MSAPLPYDLVDGGVPTIFLDGPKAGHVGLVTHTPEGPPKVLEFLGDHLIYRLRGRRGVDAADEYGRKQRRRGVAYVMDPDCHTAREAARVDAEVRARRQGRP